MYTRIRTFRWSVYTFSHLHCRYVSTLSETLNLRAEFKTNENHYLSFTTGAFEVCHLLSGSADTCVGIWARPELSFLLPSCLDFPSTPLGCISLGPQREARSIRPQTNTTI